MYLERRFFSRAVTAWLYLRDELTNMSMHGYVQK